MTALLEQFEDASTVQFAPERLHLSNADSSIKIPTQKASRFASVVFSTVFSTAMVFTSPIHTALAHNSETARTYTKPTDRIQKLDPTRPDIRLIKRIRELGTYPIGWDGADAIPAQARTVQEAEMFMRAMLSENVHEPYIALATDGEINFIWALPNFRFDLGFYGDGTYAYYGKADDGQEFVSDDSDVNEGLPQAIMSLLQA